jgi:hypothetical protein
MEGIIFEEAIRDVGWVDEAFHISKVRHLKNWEVWKFFGIELGIWVRVGVLFTVINFICCLVWMWK